MAVSDRTVIRLLRAPEAPQRGPVSFGAFLFDPALVELRRFGQLVPAADLSLNLLDYLLVHRDRVVSRQELVEQVWRGVIVTEGSLRQAIWELRQTLDDSADEQHIIRTVRGRGYRFVCTVSEGGEESASDAPMTKAPARPKTFFGRTAECERLQRALHGALREAGRAAAITGASGVGKTRLAHEISASAARQGVAFWQASADPDGAAPAFWPWLLLMRACLEALGPTARLNLQQRFPAAFRLVSPEPEVSVTSGALAAPPGETPAQFALLADLAGLLVAILGDTKTLLLIEDLQCADEASLALLRHFVQFLPRTRAFLLVTCRAQRPRQNRPLARTLEAIARSATGMQLELGSLSLDEVAELLTENASTPVPAETCAQVFALSGGNPLFAAELALLLAHSETPAASLPNGLPLDFGSVIQRRLHALPEAPFTTVLSASVLGAEFSLAELASLLEASPQETLARLDLCIDHGLFLDAPGPRFRFLHPLVREVAYASVSLSQRCRLHRLAGEWLEQSGVDVRGARLNELAHHFFHGAADGCSDKAVRYALRCAQLAYAATSYKDAVWHYDRALSCLELGPEVALNEKLETALLRGEALRASGAEPTEVNGHFLALAEQAETLGDRSLFARAVLGYTGQRPLRFTPTRFAASSNLEETALIERALSAVGDAPSELRALLLCSLMGSLMYRSERMRRESAAAEATSIARTLALPFLTVRVLTTKVYCCAAPEAAAERLATCDELLAIAAQHGLLAQEADGLITRALCHLARGDVLRAGQDEERARRIAASLSAPQVRARSELLDLMRAFWTGDLCNARRLTESALAAAPEDVTAGAFYMMRISSLNLLESGSAYEAIAGFEAMLATFPEAVGLRCALASMYAMIGERAPAVRHFDIAAQDDFKSLPEDLGWLGEMAMLADAAGYLDDRERAARVYARLAPYGHVFDFFLGESGPAGPIANWLASLATTLRDFARAREWLQVARDLNQRLGASMLFQYAHLVEARILSLSSPPEVDAARRVLDEIRAFAEPRGLRWLTACAEHEEQTLRVASHQYPDSEARI